MPEPRRRPAETPWSEERVIPAVRAALAKRLARRGFRVSDIARALRVTQPAVTQYVNGRRGSGLPEISGLDNLISPLADKLAARFRSGAGIEAAELLETARQIVVLSTGRALVAESPDEPGRARLLETLRGRFRLELDAAEKYLELANKTEDDYTKLLLRMIAWDSIRHGDVVSQMISWLEAGAKSAGTLPDEGLLRSLLSIEGSAGEESLAREVDVGHPVARLLLRWIDMDERKHERIVAGLISLRGRPAGD